METTQKIEMALPPVLPHGWKKEVASLIGVHQNTITNALKDGKGNTYNRIIHTAKQKYGKPTQTQTK